MLLSLSKINISTYGNPDSILKFSYRRPAQLNAAPAASFGNYQTVVGHGSSYSTNVDYSNPAYSYTPGPAYVTTLAPRCDIVISFINGLSKDF